MRDEKFIVFSRDKFTTWFTEVKRETGMLGVLPDPIEDAVVIRRQDMFAASALETYADSISVAISVMGMCSEELTNGTIDRLQRIADYFRAQAEVARDTVTKVPD